ncbi:MAG: hypothetical protein AAGJ50_03140, partial [Pseudomonadota bacterium]
MDKAYTRGTLLWLDDNFLSQTSFEEGSDASYWAKTFDDFDNRIYRLFNLDLEPVCSLEDAKLAIDELVDADENHDRFVMAIVDLSVPKRTPLDDADRLNLKGDYEPRLQHGIAFAKYLRKKNVPFIFLSSSSQNSEELTRNGLERVPYFKKVQRGAGALMPADAARHVLEQFRSYIGWLDLEDLMSRSGAMNQVKTPAIRFGLRYFPFFGAFRDFVERWEARSDFASVSNRIVLRTPRAHSVAFVKQCVAIIADTRSYRNDRRIVYIDARHTSENDLEALRKNPDDHILIIRFLSEDGDICTPSDKALLKKVTMDLSRCQTFFILPPDDRADELLGELSRIPGVFHDDLPATRLHDAERRHELIERVTRFVLQWKTFSTSGPFPRLDSLYLANPQLIIDPLHWTFLLEATEVETEISDPYEVLQEIYSAVDQLAVHASPALEKTSALECLETGLPLPPGQLLKPANDLYERANKNHALWVSKTFWSWLSNSWRTPWGLVPEAHPHCGDWEHHSLLVSRYLATKFCDYANLPQHFLPHASSEEWVDHMDDMALASQFLLTPVISRLLDKDTVLTDTDWDGFDALRWPHGVLPISSALNHQLKEKGGRYFFAHNDELDMATVLRDGQETLHQLEARASLHKKRLEWMQEALVHLPLGWREPAQFLHELILNRNIEEEWARNPDRVWTNISCFTNNALRLSFVFNYFAGTDAPLSAENADKGLNYLVKSQGAGKLLATIKSNRAVAFSRAVNAQGSLPSRQRGLVRAAVDELDLLQSAYRLEQKTGGDPMRGIGPLIRSISAALSANGELPDSIVRSVVDHLHNVKEPFSSGIKKNQLEDLPLGSPFHDLNEGGTQLDLLLAICHAGSVLHQILYPLSVSDGYNFLSLTGYRARNVVKNMTPDINSDFRARILEVFALSFEGLVAQLRWVLSAAGAGDLVA